MRGIFEGFDEKMTILRILIIFAVITLGITGYLKGVEGAVSGGIWTREGKTLTESEAEEVRAIWRVGKNLINPLCNLKNECIL